MQARSFQISVKFNIFFVSNACVLLQRVPLGAFVDGVLFCWLFAAMSLAAQRRGS